jgi:hypothetical protein
MTTVASAKVVSRILVVSALAVTSAIAQQPPTASGAVHTVRGVVTTANDAPLVRVRVAITGSAAVVLTDERGGFSIPVPDAETVRVTFSKAGYALVTAVLTRADLTATSAVPMRVRLSRGGAISGRVVDGSGAPVMLATVTARRTGASAAEAALSTTTNDLGDFRIGGLAEGTYTTFARPPASLIGGAPAAREAALAAAAAEGPTVSVGLGADIGNINFTIELPPAPALNASAPAPDPQATGSLRGRVVGPDGLAVPRALVRATRNLAVARTAETDARGQYVIDRLAAGEYTVEAQKYGFINRQYGQDRTSSTGRRVSVQEGQAVDAIDVTLLRGGAITGIILDEFAEPVQGVAVNAMQVLTVAGRVRALKVPSSGGRTDDRGQYRLFGLQPGSYIVQAAVGDELAAANGYVPLYYPGTQIVDQATKTAVGLGSVTPAIDFTLAPDRAYRVTGTVLDVSGKPASVGVLIATSERSRSMGTEPVPGRTNADGSFVFTNVPPGDYVIQAMGSSTAGLPPDSRGVPQPGSREFASAFVIVGNTDPVPVQLRMSAGATLNGRVVYEGMPTPPAQGVVLLARPADFDRGPLIGAGPMGFTLRPDSTFEYKGVFGPTYLSVSLRQPEWYVKSIVFKGQDLTDAPFDFGLGGTFNDIEVVVSVAGAVVAGRVVDERAASVTDYSLLIFSTLRDRWTGLGSRWVRTARPLQDGTFRVPGLPPGDYWAAAIERMDGLPGGGSAPPEADVLEQLSSRATRITLGEGQQQDVTLRLIRR